MSNRKIMPCESCGFPVLVGQECVRTICNRCLCSRQPLDIDKLHVRLTENGRDYLRESNRPAGDRDRLRVATLLFRACLDAGCGEYDAALLEKMMFDYLEGDKFSCREIPDEYREIHVQAQGQKRAHVRQENALRLTFPSLTGEPSGDTVFFLDNLIMHMNLGVLDRKELKNGTGKTDRSCPLRRTTRRTGACRSARREPHDDTALPA